MEHFTIEIDEKLELNEKPLFSLQFVLHMLI